MRKLKTKLVGAFAALSLLSGLSYAEETKTFKMATSWSGGPVMEIGAKAFAENLDRMSNGRLKVQVYPGGALGNALKVSETVKNGVADMGHTWMAYDWGRDKTTILFGGYPGSPDSERMLHWLYEAGGVELQRQYREEKFGLISMPLYVSTAEVFLHSRKPVKTLEDLKGLKLRTSGSWIEMSKQLGAAPVTVAGGDVFPMLERGAIDATEWGTLWENINPGFHKVARYIVIPGVHQPVASLELVINPKVWKTLSSEDQELISTVAKMTTLDSWLRIGQEDAKALQFYADQGNEIVELEPEVQYSVKDIADNWAEKNAADNEWFSNVLKHQQEFTSLWKDAGSYRNVKVRP